jgi:hypothetical protein
MPVMLEEVIEYEMGHLSAATTSGSYHLFLFLLRPDKDIVR